MHILIIVVGYLAAGFTGYNLCRIFDLNKRGKVLKRIGKKLDTDGIKSQLDEGYYRGAMWALDELR